VFKRHFSTIFQLYIDLWATFPGVNMVQGRNTLGYLRNRTFYIPERKYTYKYASITKCLTCSPQEMYKKSLNIHSHVESVDSQICRTFNQQYSRIKQMYKYNIDFFYVHLFNMRQCVLNRSSNQDAHYPCPRWKKNAWLKLPAGVAPLQLVNLHRNQRYFVIKLHTWFCLPFLARIWCKVKIH
jgi:hypothetical protein